MKHDIVKVAHAAWNFDFDSAAAKLTSIGAFGAAVIGVFSAIARAMGFVEDRWQHLKASDCWQRSAKWVGRLALNVPFLGTHRTEACKECADRATDQTVKGANDNA